MTTYRGTQGLRVKKVTSDPANVKEGQIWYNSTAKTIKIVPKLGAWSSGGNLNTARESGASGSEGATQNATFYAGGSNPAVSAYLAQSEEYNGSAWSEGDDLNTDRAQTAGAGTQTAGLCFGGFDGSYLNVSEEYNGSSWTEGDNLNAGRYGIGGFGSQTAGVGCAGVTPPDTNTSLTEEYNGSSWSEVNNMTTARHGIACAGTLTAGIVMGGNSASTAVELYDGTDWTNAAALPSGRGTNAANQAFGIQTSCFFLGGQPPANGTTTVQAYNGTSWSTGTALTTAVKQNSGSGTTTAGLSFGGKAGGSYTAATEEFTEAATTRTVDVS